MDSVKNPENNPESLDEQLLDVKGLDYTRLPPVSLKGEKLLHFVNEDLEEFVDIFCQLKSFDFKDFVKMWNENSMQYIFSGRPCEYEMEFFTERALIFAKDLVVNNKNNFQQVGALYLLYTLYFSQPLVNKVKIRIEHDDMKKLLNFIKAKMVADIAYAFVRLCSKRAFVFVASSLPRSAESIEPSLDSDEDFEIDKGSIKKDILLKTNAHRVIKKDNKYKELLTKLSEFDECKNEFESTSGGILFHQSTYQPTSTQRITRGTKGSSRTCRSLEFMDHLAEGFYSGNEESDEEENERDLFITPTYDSADSSSQLSNDEDDSSSSGDQTDDTISDSDSPGDCAEYHPKNSNSDDNNDSLNETSIKQITSSKDKGRLIKKRKFITDLLEDNTNISTKDAKVKKSSSLEKTRASLD